MLEWTWFLNAFSKGHLYEFMYGDKDTYGVGFALAGKAHMYQHMNMPPGETLPGSDCLCRRHCNANWSLHGFAV